MEADDRFYLVWKLFPVLGCGVTAGVFFAFSSFVMPALARLSPPQGIAAMQSMNITVVNPLFMGVFLGTAAACGFLALSALKNWTQSGSGLLLVGCVLYLVGTFLVTFLFNVPLNEALARTLPESPHSAALWNRFLVSWVFWNHVRTAASIAAAALLTLALWARTPPP